MTFLDYVTRCPHHHQISRSNWFRLGMCLCPLSLSFSRTMASQNLSPTNNHTHVYNLFLVLSFENKQEKVEKVDKIKPWHKVCVWHRVAKLTLSLNILFRHVHNSKRAEDFQIRCSKGIVIKVLSLSLSHTDTDTHRIRKQANTFW